MVNVGWWMESWWINPIVGLISVWKSSCMDWKKTSNWTGPNHSPVCIAAAKETVVDQSGCQLHSSDNIYRPSKDQLQLVATSLLVYKQVHNIYTEWVCMDHLLMFVCTWKYPCTIVYATINHKCNHHHQCKCNHTMTSLRLPSSPPALPLHKWPPQPLCPFNHTKQQHLWLQTCHVMRVLHARQLTPMLEKAPTYKK
jgi:hypothetical protein